MTEITNLPNFDQSCFDCIPVTTIDETNHCGEGSICEGWSMTTDYMISTDANGDTSLYMGTTV